jgi:hypothetical protein
VFGRQPGGVPEGAIESDGQKVLKPTKHTKHTKAAAADVLHKSSAFFVCFVCFVGIPPVRHFQLHPAPEHVSLCHADQGKTFVFCRQRFGAELLRDDFVMKASKQVLPQ